MRKLTYVGEDDGDFCIFEGKDHIANIGCQVQEISDEPQNLVAFDVDKKWAQIFTDAGNIFNETGLTPRQLLEQRDELLTTLRQIAVHAGTVLDLKWVAQEAIAKAEGK